MRKYKDIITCTKNAHTIMEKKDEKSMSQEDAKGATESGPEGIEP